MEDEGKERNEVRPGVGPPRARRPTLRRSEAEFELRVLLFPRSFGAHTISLADPSEARGVEASQLALFALLDCTYRACDIFFADHWLASQTSFSVPASMSLLGENLRPRTLLRKLSNVGRRSRSRASAVDEVHPFRLLDLPPEIVEVILSLSRSMDVLALRMVRVYCILLSLNKCTNV